MPPGTNALAYYVKSYLTAVKSYTTTALEVTILLTIILLIVILLTIILPNVILLNIILCNVILLNAILYHILKGFDNDQVIRKIQFIFVLRLKVMTKMVTFRNLFIKNHISTQVLIALCSMQRHKRVHRLLIGLARLPCFG